MSSKKTTIEWFNTVEDEALKALLLLRCLPTRKNIKEKTLLKALCGAFIWRRTPEGYDYWREIKRQFKENEKK